jgi:uncharacterized caspase-like protein
MLTFFKHSLLIPYYRYVLIICLLGLGLSFEAYAGLYRFGMKPPYVVVVKPFKTFYTMPQSALIIGNSQYEVGKLSHSVNDAKSIAKALEDQDFEVILKINLNRRKMDDAIREFRSLLSKKGGIGLFYFSGYGTQVDGKNYLLPINNARIKDEVDIEYETIPLDKILKKMQKTDSDLNIIILDVSPNTPYIEPRYKSEKNGLVKIVAPPGTIIGYATAPSSTTFHPGLYTKHLIKEIQIGGRVDDVFMRVGNVVKKESRHKQIPWHQTSLTQVFCFGECQKNIFFAKKLKWLTRGSFVAFATAKGQVAYDVHEQYGGRNGLYTKHLLRFIRKPDLSLEQIFRKVRTSVAEESDSVQLPLYEASIIDKLYFTRKRDIHKIALVIGNAHYEYSPLKNTMNDAKDMAQALKELGFEVMVKVNVTRQAMQNAIKKFTRKLGKETIGLFYFSGHGAQMEGKNYLIPINNGRIRTKNDLIWQAIQAKNVLGQMQSNSALNILILDTGRDNFLLNKSKK